MGDNEMEQIVFQKLDIRKFEKDEFMELTSELKRRKIRFRLSENYIYFDERFLKEVKDIIPSRLR